MINRINNQVPVDTSIQKLKQESTSLNIKASSSTSASVTTLTEAGGTTTIQSTSQSEAVSFELSVQQTNVTGNYTKPTQAKSSVRSIEALKAEADKALAPLRQMVEELLKQQGMHYNNSGLHIGQLKNDLEGKETGSSAPEIPEGAINDPRMVAITPEMQAEAAKQIGDGGAFSAENLSNTLVEFAKSISSEDASKFELLKDSIIKGFEAAEKAWGGELPEISKKTKELTLQKLEAWSKGE